MRNANFNRSVHLFYFSDDKGHLKSDRFRMKVARNLILAVVVAFDGQEESSS